MPEWGQAGKPGRHGSPGEPGKESGEGGRGGGGGEGGEGGEGTPKGPGGEGGGGGEGGEGARGAQGPPGPPGPQPRLRWAPAVGYVLLALVLGFLFLSNRDLVNDNRRLIANVAALDREQDEKYFQVCLTRNTRAEDSMKAFALLIEAHKKDGNVNAARIWQGYLDDIRQTPLPPCVNPPPMPPA
jgi:hypothetical protein